MLGGEIREMLTMGAAIDWVKAMRVGLRTQNGEGWTCREIRGNVQIGVRFDNGQRTTVVTDLQWVKASQAPLLQAADPITAVSGVQARHGSAGSQLRSLRHGRRPGLRRPGAVEGIDPVEDRSRPSTLVINRLI